jgi:hypothetical protein
MENSTSRPLFKDGLIKSLTIPVTQKKREQTQTVNEEYRRMARSRKSSSSEKFVSVR